MGYDKEKDFFCEEEACCQQKQWLSLLSKRSDAMFGYLLPYKKKTSLICSFIDMPQAGQLYVCGLLDDAQFVEMARESEIYHKECEAVIRENYDEELHSSLTQSIVAPTVFEIQHRLRNDVFHSPIIKKYVDIVDKIKWACIIHDLNTINYENKAMNFDDGQENYDIFVAGNDFESDARALEMCLLIRNGCLSVSDDYDMCLGKVVDCFCLEALSGLLSVPENNHTQGASKRGKWAYEMFASLFKDGGVVLDQKRELIMGDVLMHTDVLLSSQTHFDKQWREYLSDWFETMMMPYASSLVDRLEQPRKITGHEESPSMKNNGHERQE